MRLRLVALAVLVVLAAGVYLRWKSSTKSAPTVMKPPAGPATPMTTPTASQEAVPSQQQLYADIREKGLTLERAKLLFSMVIGPLPGVTVPAGGLDPHDFCGTLAVGYLYQVWSALTETERKAAFKLIEGSTTARADGARTRPALASIGFLQPLTPVAYILPKPPTPQFNYQALAQTADDTLATDLGPGVQPVQFKVNIDFYAMPENGKAYAATWSWDPDGHQWPDGCHIMVWDARFLGITNAADAAAAVTHEMFHCYQQRAMLTASAMERLPQWLVEGEPTWAMATLVPDGSVFNPSWDPYVSHPEREYWNRSQDAMGVFGHLSDGAGNGAVWPKLLPILYEGLNNNFLPFDHLIQGNEYAYYTSWGSSYFEQQGSGASNWTMTGPGSPPKSGPAPQYIQVDPGTTENRVAGPYQAGLFQLAGDADVAVVSLNAGYGRIHDTAPAGNVSYGWLPIGPLDCALDSSGPLALCLKAGGCKCPDGTPGASLITQNASAPLFVGLEGGDTGADVSIEGKSLDDFCKQKKPPTPGGGAGGRGGGGGGGGGDDNPTPSPKKPPPEPSGETALDPHLTTFDSLHYDFQVVGEYTLVRSTTDDFIVQIRQVPVFGSKTAANNQAMATRLGGQRVTVSNENGTAVLRINGKVVGGDPPALTGGSITRAMTMYGAAYRFTWPDGTVVRVDQIGRFCINVTVQPAASRHGSLAGLLGNDDGSPDNDLVGNDNAPLGPHPNAADVTHSLADAWRVTQATSLFDYRQGQSTASFIDRAFPNANVDAAGVPNRAAAEKACQDEGITDSHLLDDCILDLALTNEFLFGSAYGHAQKVLTARVALTKGVYARGQQLPVLLMSGTISEKTDQPQLQFKANAGDVIWIGPPDCNEHSNGYVVNLRLLDPQGKGSFASGCDLHRIPVSLSGTYTLKSEVVKNQFDDPTRSYHIPIHFVRHDRRQAISYGQTIGSNIDQPGAHDVYTFSAHAGDLLNITGPDCDLGTFVTGLIFPNGASGLGPGCRPGTEAKLPETGNYGLIINYFDTSTGSYHFHFRSGLDGFSR